MSKPIIGFWIVVFSSAIFLPVMWGDRQHDFWAKWIYDFQPLITGLAAVIAAYFTISEMRRIASEQASHHQENKRLATLEKRKQILRFVRRVRHTLTQASHEYDDYKNEINQEVIDHIKASLSYSVIEMRLTDFNSIIEEAKSSPIWYFLDGALESHFSSLSFLIRINFEEQKVDYYDTEKRNAPWYNSQQNHRIAYTFRSVEGVWSRLDDWEKNTLDEM